MRTTRPRARHQIRPSELHERWNLGRLTRRRSICRRRHGSPPCAREQGRRAGGDRMQDLDRTGHHRARRTGPATPARRVTPRCQRASGRRTAVSTRARRTSGRGTGSRPCSDERSHRSCPRETGCRAAATGGGRPVSSCDTRFRGPARPLSRIARPLTKRWMRRPVVPTSAGRSTSPASGSALHIAPHQCLREPRAPDRANAAAQRGGAAATRLPAIVMWRPAADPVAPARSSSAYRRSRAIRCARCAGT